MILLDVNILIHAHMESSSDHKECWSFLKNLLQGAEIFGTTDAVFASFIRISTHPRLFHNPSQLDRALKFTEILRNSEKFVSIKEGDRHWEIFVKLCKDISAKSNDISDVYLASVAMESGCELVTLDNGFRRFSGLKWRKPF